MNVINSLLSRFTQWFDYLILGIAVAVAAFLWSRRSWRWLVVLVSLVLGFAFLFLLPRRYPSKDFLDPRLPPLFLDHFWFWLLVLSLGATYSLIYLGRVLADLRRAAPAEAAPSDLAGRFPDIDAAWEAIQLHLSQAQVRLGDQHVFLVLAPDEGAAGSLIQAADLPLFAQAPDAPGPIRAWASAEGVFLGCAGASGLGVPEPDGPARLEYLCQLLLREQPDCPVVRGVVVALPVDWCAQPEAIGRAAAVREDLRVIQRALRVRCPVFAVFTRMETVPGLVEFVERMPATVRQNRCGFAVPGSQAFSGDLMQRGMVWMSGWFHSWVLNLLSEDLLAQAGNDELVSLDEGVRRLRKRLRNVLEAAFSTHKGVEPVLFRGCYFAATGNQADEQAFAAGLLRGARGRVVAEHVSTEWTAEAEAEDRRYQRRALAVGLVGGGLALLAWTYILTLTPLGWVGLGLLVLTWIIAAVRLSRW